MKPGLADLMLLAGLLAASTGAVALFGWRVTLFGLGVTLIGFGLLLAHREGRS